MIIDYKLLIMWTCCFAYIFLIMFFYAYMLITQRTAADHILRELQNNPDMWLQVVHILSNTQSMNTKFFSLQVTISIFWDMLLTNICFYYKITGFLSTGS